MAGRQSGKPRAPWCNSSLLVQHTSNCFLLFCSKSTFQTFSWVRPSTPQCIMVLIKIFSLEEFQLWVQNTKFSNWYYSIIVKIFISSDSPFHINFPFLVLGISKWQVLKTTFKPESPFFRLRNGKLSVEKPQSLPKLYTSLILDFNVKSTICLVLYLEAKTLYLRHLSTFEIDSLSSTTKNR